MTPGDGLPAGPVGRVARSVFSLFRARGVVEGESWRVVEGYGCRHPLAEAPGDLEVVLLRGEDPGGRLAVTTVDPDRADELGDLLVRLLHVLESSGSFRRGEPVEREADPWRVPSIDRREGRWEARTRVWGRDVPLQVQDQGLTGGS